MNRRIVLNTSYCRVCSHWTMEEQTLNQLKSWLNFDIQNEASTEQIQVTKFTSALRAQRLKVHPGQHCGANVIIKLCARLHNGSRKSFFMLV